MDRHPRFRDGLGLAFFILGVIIGTIIVNTFIFRSFTVEGASMETTMHTNDKLIVNRIPVTIARLQNKPYLPKRGQIIVFKNPNYNPTVGRDEYIVKRVIAFAGERVVVRDGTVTVFTQDQPQGFNPDSTINHNEPGQPTSGEVDTTVGEGTIFVMGDNRQGNHSCDSRNCMGNIPLFDIVGPVSFRLWPLTKLRSF